MKATRRFHPAHLVAMLATFAAILFLAAMAVMPRPAHAQGLLDGNEDFKLLAELGFEQAVDGAHAQGTRTNDYAWSMAWFKGKLYVGTGRFEIDASTGQPRAGQIWRYTPGGPDGRSGTWEFVFESPGFIGGGAREFGYRWMTACTFEGVEYLFISTLGTFQGNILYTSNGTTFTPVNRAGFPSNTVGFRTMACFNEGGYRSMLVTTPVGKAGDAETFDPDRADNPIVISNTSPTSNTSWREYSAMRMGDPNNGVIFSMYAAGQYLYAGVTNEVSGGQLWRTTGCLPQFPLCTPFWNKVMDRGAGRPKTAGGIVKNAGFADMMMFNGDLYLAMSATALDRNAITAEILRYRADGMVEVMIGEPRMDGAFNRAGQPTNPNLPSNFRCGVAPEALNGGVDRDDCPPTSRRGAGFGEIGNATTGYPDGQQFYFWRLFNYAYHGTLSPKGDNRLYLGTAQGGFASEVGFDIYATVNGSLWQPITKDGLGYRQQQGMRSIAATPYGLAVGGTHFPIPADYPNPYGEPEIRGANVWMGVPTVVADATAPVTTIASPPSPVEGATINVRNPSFSWTGVDTPSNGSLTYAVRLEPVDAGFSAFTSATSKAYTGLPNGTYTFHVIARDASGNTEAAGAAPGAANRRTFTVDAPNLPPTVTINVAPAATSTSSTATFAWTGSDDLTPAGNLTYNRWLSPVGSDMGNFIAGTTSTHTGLIDGAYTFHVIAKDAEGNVSNEVTHNFTVAIPVGPPGSAAPVTISVVAPRTVRVTWTNVAGETRYEIERCQGVRSCSFQPLVSNVPADSASYDDVVPASGAYGYRVRACNGSGCSAWAQTTLVSVP